MIIFGKDERAKVEAERENYSEQVQRIYDEAKTYHDGKWVMFYPVTKMMMAVLDTTSSAITGTPIHLPTQYV